jgi:uncharacterized protein (TIGR03437 family)
MKSSRALALALPLFCLLLSAQQRREREVDNHQAEREEWFYGQRAYPLGHIPTGARLNAIQRIDQMDRARAQAVPAARITAAAASARWTLIGPRPTDAGSTYVTAGRVNAIAVDPRNNNTVYIGAAEGGVWKTTDGGSTWRPLTDDQPSLATGAIVLDPANPDTVYVGTGEENFSIDSYYGAGILKSTDGGASWTNLVGPFLRARIGAMAIDPTNSQILLCTTQTGVWRSTDGANTWTNTLTGAAGTSVAFDPTNGKIAYAGLGTITGDSNNGVYRSTDGGQTWNLSMGSGANSLPSVSVGRVEIAVAPSTPTTLYVAIQDTGNDMLLGMYKSTDSGATWNQLVDAPQDLCAEQCWYDMTVHVHPSNPDIVFAGGFQIFRTMDGGASWDTLPLFASNQVELHVDEHFLAFTPDATKLYIANDGGVYSTTDITAPFVNWTELNDTLALAQFYPGMTIDPSNVESALAGTQDNGTQRYGGSPSWNDVTCGDGGWTAIDTAVATTALAACQDIEIRRTADGGNTWMSSQYGIDQSDRTAFISPLVNDPSNPQTAYFGTFRVWRTLDSGGVWSSVSPDLTEGFNGKIRALAVAPSDGNTVYAGASNLSILSTSTPEIRLSVTRNAYSKNGPSWIDRTAGLPARVITQIRVDPIDAATAYVTFSGFAIGQDAQGHVFRTTDAGASWNDISGDLPNLPVNDIAIDPDLPDTLYIGTDAGVMVTTDGGANWSTLGSGLPRVVVYSLVLHRASRTLRAATHGRSVWDIAVPLSSASMQPSIASISPNVVNAGGPAFALSVKGSHFNSSTIVRWNGQDRTTQFVDRSHLTAQISASDIANVGRASILAFSSSTGAGASSPVALTIGPAPASSSNAIVSAANPLGGSAVAPLSIASIYGTHLAGGTIGNFAPPLPVTAGGTMLTFSPQQTPAPLFFISPGQINFQVPRLPPGPNQLTITQGALSTTVTVMVTPYAPALFTTNSQGTGQAAALIAGTATLAAPAGTSRNSRPASKGDFLSVFCTGLGEVFNGPNAGDPAPSDPPAETILRPSVTIGGVPSHVSFSGLAPGFAGLYQVNVQVPSTAPSGPSVPVVLKIGGKSSNTATIAIE